MPHEEMVRVAVAHQRDAILITEAERVDPGGRRILWVNRAFTQMTGFTAAEAVGRTPGLTIGPESDRGAIRAIQEAIDDKRAVRQEILKYRKDGSTVWVEIDIAPVYGPRGAVLYFVSVMRDISDKREAERLLALQAEALRQALAARSLFLANVSHELRTPLNAILGYTSNLEKGIYGPLEPTQKLKLGRVTANGMHLLELIDELLDLTRIESGRVSLQVETFDLAELVARVLLDLEPLVTRSGLDVSVSSTGRRLLLRSDRHKVKQIVVNLLSNALKFTQHGSVHVTLAKEARDVTVGVADTGVGIAPELHRRVFEDFWQVDDASMRSVGGAGLGLAISRRLAQLLGGDLSLTSTVGEGSCFTLRLPREVAPEKRASKRRR